MHLTSERRVTRVDVGSARNSSDPSQVHRPRRGSLGRVDIDVSAHRCRSPSYSNVQHVSLARRSRRRSPIRSLKRIVRSDAQRSRSTSSADARVSSQYNPALSRWMCRSTKVESAARPPTSTTSSSAASATSPTSTSISRDELSWEDVVRMRAAGVRGPTPSFRSHRPRLHEAATTPHAQDGVTPI